MHVQLSEAVDVRTTDKPEVSIKLKLKLSGFKYACSTRLYASGVYLRARPKDFRLAGPDQCFAGSDLPGDVGSIDSYFSNMHHGCLASGSDASVAPSASDKMQPFLLPFLLACMLYACGVAVQGPPEAVPSPLSNVFVSPCGNGDGEIDATIISRYLLKLKVRQLFMMQVWDRSHETILSELKVLHLIVLTPD